MGFSNARAIAILNQEFRTGTVFLALYTTSPTAADTGTEVSGGAYVRQPITFSVPAVEAGQQTIKNLAEILFPIATADWGTITHFGIRTAATAGTLITFGALQNARTINAGERLTLTIGNGVLRLS